jgi:two-component system, chemotaxis family, sensor kinase CheA
LEIDREAIFQTFLIESEEHFAIMEEALLALESHPEDEELLQTIFRMAHTIKGSAACLGFQTLTEFAHVLEDLLEKLRDHTIVVTDNLITILLQAVDVLKQMGPDAVAGIEEMQPSYRAVLKQLVQESQKTERHEKTTDDIAASQLEELLNQGVEGTSISNEQRKTLRIDIEKLDHMLTLTGEISIARGRLRQLVEKLDARTRQEILEADQDIERLYMELQELVMKSRMVPVGPVFRRYIRVVRDLATTQGKQVNLRVEGADVEVDTRIIEHLTDPLTHLIRNAIDHGIESPDLREAQGKEPCGTITLRAYHDSGNIIIQLSDDGSGLNRKRILERAWSSGMIGEKEELTDQQIYRLVYKAGFSTARDVTDISGRGVGMDIVRRNIEALRGSVEISSCEGEGATITIRLPLTLAIIDGFKVGVDNSTYIIPMETVLECIELPEEQRYRADKSGVVNLRDQPLPYIRLRHFFDLGGTACNRESIVVVQYNDQQAGIVVDSIYGESQAVIKPLGKMFRELPNISGCTVLGSGEVALILDVSRILHEVIERETSIVAH